MDAAALPTIVYNVPGRTACNILPETVEQLAADERVVGLKEASGDISQIAEIARRVSERIALYSGNDDQIVPVLALGGVGVISVLANVAPADTSAMVRHFLRCDVAEARRLQLAYLPLIETLFREPNPVPVKAAVRLLGFDVGEVRLPLLAASEETLARLTAETAGRRAQRAAGHPRVSRMDEKLLIAVCGATGRMGRAIADLAAADADVRSRGRARARLARAGRQRSRGVPRDPCA